MVYYDDMTTPETPQWVQDLPKEFQSLMEEHQVFSDRRVRSVFEDPLFDEDEQARVVMSQALERISDHWGADRRLLVEDVYRAVEKAAEDVSYMGKLRPLKYLARAVRDSLFY